MRMTIIQDLVIDLIREDDDFLFSGKIGDLLQDFFGYTAPVGLLGLMTTIALVFEVILDRDIPEIRYPITGFITDIMYRLTS